MTAQDYIQHLAECHTQSELLKLLVQEYPNVACDELERERLRNAWAERYNQMQLSETCRTGGEGAVTADQIF